MNGKYILIAVLLFCGVQTLTAQIGVEQYCYLWKNGNTTQVQLVHYQTSKNFYVEARYNYEEQNTGAIYIGKTFSSEDKLSYSITPIVGGVFGKFKGGSAGFNGTAEYHKIYFSTQTQYTFSAQDETINYFFSWSELGYEIRHWVYAGAASQQTNIFKTKGYLEPGVVVGFVFGNWTFPLYAFSPMSDKQYYVFGVNLNLGLRNKVTR